MECKLNVFIKWVLLLTCTLTIFFAGKKICLHNEKASYYFFTYYRTLKCFYLNTPKATEIMDYPIKNQKIYNGFILEIVSSND